MCWQSCGTVGTLRTLLAEAWVGTATLGSCGVLAQTRPPSCNDSIRQGIPTENACTRSRHSKSSCISILSVPFYMCLIFQKKTRFSKVNKNERETKSPTKAKCMSTREAMEHDGSVWGHSHHATLYPQPWPGLPFHLAGVSKNTALSVALS